MPLIIIISSYLLDVITKLLIVKTLKLYEVKEIIGDVLRFKYIENKGMAFGLFSELPEPYKHLILLPIIFVAIGVVVYFYRSVHESKYHAKYTLALILGGALGNLSDKLIGYIVYHQEFKFFYNRVVDFIDVGIGTCRYCRWPTFNVADIAITVGVLLLLMLILFGKDKDIFVKKKKPSDEPVNE